MKNNIFFFLVALSLIACSRSDAHNLQLQVRRLDGEVCSLGNPEEVEPLSTAIARLTELEAGMTPGDVKEVYPFFDFEEEQLNMGWSQLAIRERDRQGNITRSVTYAFENELLKEAQFTLGEGCAWYYPYD